MNELLTNFDAGILTLTINRIEARNTLNETLTEDLRIALQQAAVNPEVRCVVLTGAGGVFCAGGDVNEQADGSHFAGDASSAEEIRRGLVNKIRHTMELSRLLHEMPKPTLAVIPGAAAGAGLSLALACDMRFCLDSAKLTTAFSRVGLSGDNGGAFFLPYLVGAAKARELYFNADVLTGQQAYDIGLVTKIASRDNFEAEARAYAQHLASLPTVAVGCLKQNLNAAYRGDFNKVFDLEAENIVRCMLTDDHKRAAKAYINKEKVVFEGH